MKLVETSDFTSFSSLLMFGMCLLACKIIALALFMLIGIIICFLERLLMVMLSFGLFFNSLLLVILWILMILSNNSLGNTSLILIISLILLL